MVRPAAVRLNKATNDDAVNSTHIGVAHGERQPHYTVVLNCWARGAV